MPDPAAIGLLGLGALALLLALRMPIGLAMIAVGVGGTYALSLDLPHIRFAPYLRGFKSLLWETVASYDLSVVPLFVLMGYLAAAVRLSTDLFRGLEALLSRRRGGVAMAALGACGGFGAVCGSSLATAATMGRVALPELRRQGYDPRLAAGTLAAGGTLGILIPPSLALVLYAVVVDGSILEMFRAALLPGAIAFAGFLAALRLQIALRPGIAPIPAAMPAAARARALRRLWPVLGLFGAIVAGLGAGLFTPTPAAAIGVFAVLAYGAACRTLTRDGLAGALRATAVTSGMIYLILFGAEVLKGFFTRAGVPQALADWALGSGWPPLAILAAILALLLFLGCLMESLAMILVVVPFVWPALLALNAGGAVPGAFGLTDAELKVWFGILALCVVELGLITPPVGLNVFVIAQVDRATPPGTVFAGVLPFVGAEILRIGVLLMVPWITLWLPRAIG